MPKQYYVLHLLPPRATFSQDMNAEERAIMTEHVGYWRDFMAKGHVLAFGPVMHPEGAYGLGIVEVDNEAQVLEFMKNDPAAKINRYEYFPMRAVVREG